MKNILFIILTLFSDLMPHAFSQELASGTIDSTKQNEFRYSSLIIPAALIGYGAIGFKNDGIKWLNSEVKEEVNEHIDKKLTIDDFSQYAPAFSVYALNAMGIKGRNNFKNRTLILGTSFLLMSTTVVGLKTLTKVERPDGTSKNSFPSGHTATAFMGAEFLMQEYKDVSVWYGVTGYVVAAGTGLFRIYNNRHWVTDVAAGAGIGILTTKVAYWINPFLNEKLFKQEDKEQKASIIYPYYNGQQIGFNFAFLF